MPDDDEDDDLWLLIEISEPSINVRTRRSRDGLIYHYNMAVQNEEPCLMLTHTALLGDRVFVIEYDEEASEIDLMTAEERAQYFARKRRESRVVNVLRSMYPSLVWDMGGDTGSYDDEHAGHKYPTLTFADEKDLVLFKLYW